MHGLTTPKYGNLLIQFFMVYLVYIIRLDDIMLNDVMIV
jgi:hypothetical protein